MDDLLVEYLSGSAGLSPKTISTIKNRMTRFADQVQMPLNMVTSEQVIAFFDSLLSRGLSSATCAGYRTTIRAFYKWAKDEGKVAKNPAKALKGRRYAFSFRPVKSRAAPSETVDAILKAMPEFAEQSARNLRDAALISLAIDSGARRGELHNLKRAEMITCLKWPKKTKSGLISYSIESTGKTGLVTLIFFEDTADYMRRWLKVMPPCTWLWPSFHSFEQMLPDVMRLGLVRLCEYANVPPVGWHSLRKRAVTDIIEMTGDPAVGARLANHRSIATTQTYYNDVSAGRVNEAAALLAARRRE